MPDITLSNRDLLLAIGTNDAPGGLLLISKRDLKNIKASYAITKVLRAVEGPLKDLDAMRAQLVEKHGEKNAEGKLVEVEGGYKLKDPVAFAKDWEALMDESVTLPGLRAVTIDELDGTGATPQELFAAGPFVVES